MIIDINNTNQTKKYIIIFLDIDGVLAPYKHFKNVHRIIEERPEFKSKYYGSHAKYSLRFLCRDSIATLNKMIEIIEIVEQREVRIVISSTWRRGRDLRSFRPMFNLKGFKYSDRIIDKTAYLGGVQRGIEIQDWISSNEELIYNFFILDDDSDMAHLKDHLVKTNGMKSLVESDIAKAINILRNTEKRK